MKTYSGLTMEFSEATLKTVRFMFLGVLLLVVSNRVSAQCATDNVLDNRSTCDIDFYVEFDCSGSSAGSDAGTLTANTIYEGPCNGTPPCAIVLARITNSTSTPAPEVTPTSPGPIGFTVSGTSCTATLEWDTITNNILVY